MKRLATWLAVAVCLTAWPAVLPAQETPHLCFSAVDGDGDAQVTLAELQAAYPGLPPDVFVRLDVNRDGVLSHDEYHDALGHGVLDRTGRSD